MKDAEQEPRTPGGGFPVGGEGAMSTRGIDSARPALSVIVRTRGDRLLSLEEALLCLCAQSRHDFETILVVHTESAARFDGVERLVDSFDDRFRARLRTVQHASGGRSAPLNAGLELSRGDYVVFLDDDDLVTSDWVETFVEAAAIHPGRALRAACLLARVRRVRVGEIAAPFHRVSGPARVYAEDFDFLQHLTDNQTPICSFAVPRYAISELGLRFRDDLPVLEDWHMLIRVAQACGMVDTHRITSIYQYWDDDGGSQEVGRANWARAREAVALDLDLAPLHLPPGSASRIASLQQRALAAERVLNSTTWRVLGPVRRVLDSVKSVGRRARARWRRRKVGPLRRFRAWWRRRRSARF